MGVTVGECCAGGAADRASGVVVERVHWSAVSAPNVHVIIPEYSNDVPTGDPAVEHVSGESPGGLENEVVWHGHETSMVQYCCWEV